MANSAPRKRKLLHTIIIKAYDIGSDEVSIDGYDCESISGYPYSDSGDCVIVDICVRKPKGVN